MTEPSEPNSGAGAPPRNTQEHYLLFVRGPWAGRRLPFNEGEVWIGRDDCNSLQIPDLTVSRRHCHLILGPRGVEFEDAGSANGSFVNGRAVPDRLLLQSGDQIDIGATRFIVQSAGTLVETEDEEAPELLLRSTMYVSQTDVQYSRPEAPPLPPSRQVVTHLQSLLGLAAVAGEVQDLTALQKAVVEAALGVIPAERGALAVLDGIPDTGMPVSARAYRRGSTEPVPFTISRSVVREIAKTRAGVLSNDVREHAALHDSRTLLSTGTQAVLAAPLLIRGTLRGLLYLDLTSRAGEPVIFEESHLQWAVAAARIAALALANLSRREELELENRELRDGDRGDRQMVGDGRRMHELYRVLLRVGSTDSTVLLAGESGTGKELAARSIHNTSGRRDKAFIAVNCAMLTESLLESELFGHEKGSFTGAAAMKKGKIELADGGTLFLDELGELAVPLQAKLLRVLQEQVIERIGGVRPIPVDVRLVAASNRNLSQMVAEGHFRADLYYRLNVVKVHLPPLRDRMEDIPALAEFFAQKCALRARRRVRGVSPAAIAVLQRYEWPGNIRELENAIERAVVLGQDEWVQPEDLPEELLEHEPPRTEERTLAATVASDEPEVTEEDQDGDGGFHDAVRDAKRQIILRTFEKAGYRHTEAARLLNIHPNNLHRTIRALGLKDILQRRGA